MNTIKQNAADIIDLAKREGSPEITPVVAYTMVGCGTTTTLRDVARERGLHFMEYRPIMMDFRDFQPLHAIRNGEIVLLRPVMEGVDLVRKGPSVVVVDDPLAEPECTIGVIEQLARHAAHPILLILPLRQHEREDADKLLDIVSKGLGLVNPTLGDAAGTSGHDEIRGMTLCDPTMIHAAILEAARDMEFPEHVVSYLEAHADLGGGNLRTWRAMSEIEKTKGVGAALKSDIRPSVLGEEPARRFESWLEANRERFPDA